MLRPIEPIGKSGTAYRGGSIHIHKKEGGCCQKKITDFKTNCVLRKIKIYLENMVKRKMTRTKLVIC
jgi:hypothetical protein